MGLCSENRSGSDSIRVVQSADSLKPELSVQAVRMPVEVYSGIAPPQALLDQMMNRPTAQPVQTHNLRPPGFTGGPSQGYSPGSSGPPGQAQSDHVEPSPSDIPSEAPPSYEDAMADTLAPVDGPRRDYSAQPSSRGEKSADDERLFP